MHYLMLVTLTMLPGETSPEVRERIYSQLVGDSSFCGDGGRFASPVCDWFVLGGRWSGLLRETVIGDVYRDKLAATFPEFTASYYSTDRVKERAGELDALWQEFGGSGPSSLNRDAYREFGYDDDAMLLDRTLYDKFLITHAGALSSHGDDGACEFIDLDDEDVDESFIGRKWIAVVDYHS
jgi:hypothetical protein